MQHPPRRDSRRASASILATSSLMQTRATTSINTSTNIPTNTSTNISTNSSTEITTHDEHSNHNNDVDQALFSNATTALAVHRAVLESTEHAIIATDLDGVIVVFNRSAEVMLGYHASEVVGLSTPAPFHDFDEVIQYRNELRHEYQDDSIDGFSIFIARAQREKIPDRRRWTYIRKNKTRLPVMLSVTALYDPDDQHKTNIIGFLGIAVDITEEVKKEKATRLLDVVGNIAKVGGWEVDLTTTPYQIHWSPETYRIHEMDENTPIDLATFLSFYGDNEKEYLQKTIQQAINAGGSWEYERIMTTAKGNQIWVRSSGRAEKKNGRPIRLYGAFQNITDIVESRERAEKNARDLAKEQKHVEEIQHLARVGGWQYIPSTKELLWSPTLRELFGIDLDTPNPNQAALSKIHPEDSAFVHKAIFDAIEDGIPYNIRFRIIPYDGELRYLHAIANIIYNDDGSVLLLHGSMQDVTEQTLLTLAVQQSEIVLRHRTNCLPLVVFEFAFDANHPQAPPLQFVSKYVEQLYGTSQEDALRSASGLTSFVHPEDQEFVVESSQTAIKYLQAWSHDFRIIHPTKGILWVHSEFSPYRLPASTSVVSENPLMPTTQQTRWIGFTQDITARKNLEDELRNAKESAESAARAKSNFLSMMSHEIRTPINAIVGMSHILADENPQPHQLDTIKTLKFSSTNLIHLVNDLLDYSKIDAGKISLEKINFNLVDLIRNICHEQKFKADENLNTISITSDMNLPSVLVGDPTRIGQIVSNLVGNAVKFTQKGRIEVGIRIAGKRPSPQGTVLDIRLTVSDTGIGIDPRHHARIFEAFAQAEDSTTRQFGGTGLGLTITKRIVDLHHGKIRVESSVGQGSRFIVDIPILSGSNTNSYLLDQPRQKGTNSDHPPRHILLAEDNPTNVIVARKFLQKWGHSIDVAENGAIAVALFEKAQNEDKYYDLVLLDLQMPVMDGYDAAKAIRQLNARIPIIALTASTGDDISDAVRTSGIDDVSTKPFNPNELREKIETWSKAWEQHKKSNP